MSNEITTFGVNWVLNAPLAENESDQFLDQFIDLVEKNEMRCGGGQRELVGLFNVEPHNRQQRLSLEHRRVVENWLAERNEVDHFTVGGIVVEFAT